MSGQGEAVPTKLIENERVRVTEWRFAPGAATGWHRHEHDYVVVPLYDGKLKIVEGGEEKIAELQKKKRQLADSILAGDDSGSVLQDLSMEDLELLLS